MKIRATTLTLLGAVAATSLLWAGAPVAQAHEGELHTAEFTTESGPDLTIELEAAQPWVEPTERVRAAAPIDRYDLASGCYGIRSVADDAWLVRSGDGFSATASDLAGAEAFHFRATDLGSYLVFGTAEDYLAAQSLVPGVTFGPAVEHADDPSTAADWVIDGTPDAFTFTLASGEQLASDGAGALTADAASGTSFAFEQTTGCAVWPDVKIGVTGDHPTGDTGFETVQGYVDAHVHMMAFEFVGGRARCGKPWDRFGVTFALVDCPDHEGDGQGAALETFLSGGEPGEGHDTVGWPTFVDWPAPASLTHEQMYYRWLERSWRAGQRMMVNLLVENGVLCELYPLKKNSCDEMDAVRLQAADVYALQDYIDAQHGGPGEGWFRVVVDPFEARRVINSGRLAIVLGIETSEVFGCTQVRDIPQCTEAEIIDQLDEVYDLGIRQMELLNKFDNAFAGVAGDGGSTGVVVNNGNFYRTGSFWAMERCDHEHDDNEVHDREQSQNPIGGENQDAIFGAILQVSGQPLVPPGTVPLYGSAPHCNARALTDLGAFTLEQMRARSMLFDPDHMSVAAREDAIAEMAAVGYPGVLSSHGWSTPDVFDDIYAAGGIITPYAGGSEGFVNKWRSHRPVKDDRYFFGFGFGADTNGFGSQGGPRSSAADNPLSYPITGFGGVTIDKQVSGERVYDLNVDGVAHYGLYADWFADLALLGGEQLAADMLNGSEHYLQMWERTVGVAPDRCLFGGTDPGIDVVEVGMTPEEVLAVYGQPFARDGDLFTYCVPDSGAGLSTAVVTYDDTGRVAGRSVSAGAPDGFPVDLALPFVPGETPAADDGINVGSSGGSRTDSTTLPATGRGAPTAAIFVMLAGMALTAVVRRSRRS